MECCLFTPSTLVSNQSRHAPGGDNYKELKMKIDQLMMTKPCIVNALSWCIYSDWKALVVRVCCDLGVGGRLCFNGVRFMGSRKGWPDTAFISVCRKGRGCPWWRFHPFNFVRETQSLPQACQSLVHEVSTTPAPEPSKAIRKVQESPSKAMPRWCFSIERQ